MSAKNTDTLTVGTATVQNTTYPWPNTWIPSTYPTNYYVSYPAPPAEKYANEVEVEQNEHDATLRFYRTRDKSRSLVHEVTVPLGVLEWMQAKEQTPKKRTSRKR